MVPRVGDGTRSNVRVNYFNGSTTLQVFTVSHSAVRSYLEGFPDTRLRASVTHTEQSKHGERERTDVRNGHRTARDSCDTGMDGNDTETQRCLLGHSAHKPPCSALSMLLRLVVQIQGLQSGIHFLLHICERNKLTMFFRNHSFTFQKCCITLFASTKGPNPSSFENCRGWQRLPSLV